MSRATLISVLVLSGGVVALICAAAFHRSPGLTEAERQESEVSQQEAGSEAELSNSKSLLAVPIEGDQERSVPEGDPPVALADVDSTHTFARNERVRELRSVYALLLEDLALGKEKKEALMTWLMEQRTNRSAGGRNTTAQNERSTKIAGIIGYSKLQEFLALESNIRAYTELHTVGNLLRQNGAPLTADQRTGLLQILSKTKASTSASSDAGRGTVEFLEQKIDARDEYERHVLELAPSVLKSKQVQYLFEHYQYLSDNRANAIEMQKKQRFEHPGEKIPSWYPIE